MYFTRKTIQERLDSTEELERTEGRLMPDRFAELRQFLGEQWVRSKAATKYHGEHFVAPYHRWLRAHGLDDRDPKVFVDNQLSYLEDTGVVRCQ